jgi:4-alpha-glucanotransferase
MAGNPLLISPENLAHAGLLSWEELSGIPEFPKDAVDFDAVIPFKWGLLRKAAARFFAGSCAHLRGEYERFCEAQSEWLNPFVEFAALKESNDNAPWTIWPEEATPDPEEVRVQKLIQFEFFREWGYLKRYCNDRGIAIVGDLPIFVAHDSADVRSHPELFDLDEFGLPRVVAGVPPDYFSKTGQLWGNPVYRWDVMAENGYRWWIRRMEVLFETVDMVRLDHFRGFEKYWAVPVGETTAERGEWNDGPGDSLFEALRQALGRLPVIAEDLGLITPEVHALRERWDFPGMRVLQFAFGSDDPTDPFKPHNFPRNCVVYTGTHDNDTTVGWFRGSRAGDHVRTPEEVARERSLALRYLGSDGREVHWDFIRAAMASVADTAIFPMQDVLGLGSDARMNIPSKATGNWLWRLQADQLTDANTLKLLDMARLYGR